MGEKWPMNFCLKMPDFHVTFTCRKSTTWNKRLYFPSEGRLAEDFFALKNPTASAGFEPANLGTKGQHATSRPPKLLNVYVTLLLSVAIELPHGKKNIVLQDENTRQKKKTERKLTLAALGKIADCTVFLYLHADGFLRCEW